MKSGDFAAMVGERALHYDPITRALYETLKSHEDHHAEQHKDCENRSADAVRLAMSFAGKSATMKSAE